MSDTMSIKSNVLSGRTIGNAMQWRVFFEGNRDVTGWIMERLQSTSESVIGVQLLVLNLQHSRQTAFCRFWYCLPEITEGLLYIITLVIAKMKG